MKLHDEDIFVNDTVYDVSAGRGAGRVFLVKENSFHVVFPDGKAISYDSIGRQHGKPQVTLYWHRPVILSPVKNANRFDERVALINKVLDIINYNNN